MSDNPPTHKALAIAAFAAFFVVFIAGLGPLNFGMPQTGMEGSWIWASVHAGLNRFAYGTQFVFTNGPLFPLYHREYAGGATGFYLLARLAVALYLAYGFARLTMGGGRAAWAALLLAVVIVWPTIASLPNDSILLAVPLLAALLVFADRGGWVALIVGVVLTAALSIAKVSFIPFALGAFVLVDIALISRRRAPLSLLGYVVASFALFVAAGQQAGQFVPFLIGSYEMAAGYSAALSLDGSPLELHAWLALNAVILVALLVQTRRGGLMGWLRLALFAGFAFIALKAGFVRHDTHSVAAWGCTLFALILCGLPGTLPNWSPRRMAVIYAVPLLATLVLLGYSTVSPALRGAATVSAQALGTQIGQVVAFTSNPSAWFAAAERRAEAAAADIRAGQPLPALAGSVDAIANMQSAVLAAGLDYAPRPTIQENMSVTPALIARNRAFLEGPQAPDYLFFAPGATDGRHPASIEGSLWPLLLARYDISETVGDLLLLARRETPLEVTATEVARTQIGFGEELALPSGAPLFLKLDIRRTLLGRLSDAAFKPPIVKLTVSYADASSESFRLIPGMIAEGMVISPTVKTIGQYRALTERHTGDARLPVSLRIETIGAWAYEPMITATLETLTIAAGS